MRTMSSAIKTSTPKDDGFYMPAEWHQHSGVLMLWPERSENWKEKAQPARIAFANVIKAISEFENVTVGVTTTGWDSAEQLIGTFPGVTMKKMEYDDVWTRDTGPTFLINKSHQLGGVSWDFNCWGMLGGILDGVSYNVPCEKDKLLSKTILNSMDINAIYETNGFVLEGGSIHVDGEGTLITTEECLLNKNRNPHLSKEMIENYLYNYLGVNKIIWLPLGLTADNDTNGHIDNICCFISPSVLLLAWCDDINDKQYNISRQAYTILSNTTDAKGRDFTIIKMPIPTPMYYTEEDCNSLELLDGKIPTRIPGERLAASYVNFYIPNGKFLKSYV